LLGEILRKFRWCFLGLISEVFLFFRRKKLSVAKQPRAISHYLWAGKKEKLKFGRSQATSGFREVFAKQKFGWKKLQVSETSKSLLYSPDRD
jgi:hypothetical protein